MRSLTYVSSDDLQVVGWLFETVFQSIWSSLPEKEKSDKIGERNMFKHPPPPPTANTVGFIMPPPIRRIAERH